MVMKSSDFLVNLPDTAELKPFPTHANQSYIHDQIDRCGSPIGIALTIDGDILAVCYSRALAIFDVRSTRCIRTMWSKEGESFYGV